MNQDVKEFENRSFKEKMYVDFSTLTIYPEELVPSEKILSDSKCRTKW